MSLRCVLSVLRSMNGMTPCSMGVMCRLFMTRGLMMRGRFAVVPGGVGVVFSCLPVVFRCFLGHPTPPWDC